jgi:hypothetical protein
MGRPHGDLRRFEADFMNRFVHMRLQSHWHPFVKYYSTNIPPCVQGHIYSGGAGGMHTPPNGISLVGIFVIDTIVISIVLIRLSCHLMKAKLSFFFLFQVFTTGAVGSCYHRTGQRQSTPFIQYRHGGQSDCLCGSRTKRW